jgi:Tol biopolymer transport system component/predicted negative regulator of RcsB-dependent stress response
MELVQGVSITEYCDGNTLGTKDRLGLFIQVCRAVQHAHQKGIIHRDIKPSNVMVTHHDGKPVPKIIDFGIAKAVNQKLTEKTLFTRYAHLVGTPAYMSPEQAELSDLDIDTRTDIYSLGVLLYELLTGTTPFSEEELRKAGYVEMQRVIREQEPAKPSTKLSTLGETLTDIAKHRGCTPDLLRKAVRGDLDWIVMKSLEKDRARRYETPNSLASDILRHLEHEPVLARGPSTTYRVERFLRRHRIQAGAILAIVVVAVAGSIMLSMWNRDRAQLAEAEGFKHRGILSQAREQYAKAERDAAMATINPIRDSKHVGAEARLLEATILVDNRRSQEAMAVLGGLLDEKPEIAGAAHSLLARILWEGESPDAQKLEEIQEHRKQAEAMLPETAEAYFLRAMTALTVKEQLAALDKALQLEPGHYESRRLRAYTYYASRKYDRLRDDALVMTVLRPRDLLGYSLRAAALRELGQHREAIIEYDNAIALTSAAEPQHVDLRVQRCETFLRMGDYERVIAEATAEGQVVPRVAGILPAIRGRDALDTEDRSPLQYHKFAALTALGEYDAATALFREIIAPGHESRQKFRDWCAKYVFDTFESGRSWHPADQVPTGAAFLPMTEAEETYRSLVAKGAHRLTTDGFSARWSPDGKKLAFSLGVQGYSGVAIFDPATKETDLLIVPGKDPRWSPDGKYIAFIRDRQNLRLEELLTPEPGSQRPPETDEELWIMNADGTAPRRLAQGSWPSWGSDSASLYYLSRKDSTLSQISLADQEAEPKPIMKWSYVLPSVSPDNRYVSYFEGGSLKIKDLASQDTVAECRMPSMAWGVTGWAPTGNEVCLGGGNPQRDSTGLWLYDLQKKEFLRVLDGQITATCWSPTGTELTFCLGTPHQEVWNLPLDPSIPTAETLGLGQTLAEHLREMAAFHTRRIEADPNDAYAYSSRAQYYDSIGDKKTARADMRKWSAILSGGSPNDCSSRMRDNFDRVINLPFGCEFAFSAERPVNAIPMMSVAFGQKGRWEMKVFEGPMFVASLLGLCVASGLDAPPAYANFTFGEPVNLRSVIPVLDPAHECIECFSYDGLEVYVISDRVDTQGGFDLCVLKRTSIEAEWGSIENLGHVVNSTADEWCASISGDGLTLYFTSDRPGGYGWADIWMTTRVSSNDPWGQPLKIPPKVNTTGGDGGPWISPDGLELYFGSLD